VSDEEDYFRKIDQEAKGKLKAKLETQRAEADLAARKDLHFMKCGKCGGAMVTEVFRGIEIEVCSGCNAVLLDPGELEQLAGEDSSMLFKSFFSMFGGDDQR